MNSYMNADSVRIYARAYINVYGRDLTQPIVDNIQRMAFFFKKHQRAVFLLQIPLIAITTKIEKMEEVCVRFGAPFSLIRLAMLLLEHDRMRLLSFVLQEISNEYNKQHNVHTVHVSTSCPVDAAQQEKIESFISQQFSGINRYVYTQDPSLIMGIRIQTDTLLWENSIKRCLRQWSQQQIL